jgi:hypothetical protein
MSRKGQSIAAWREGNIVNPAGCAVEVLSANCVEWSLSPHADGSGRGSMPLMKLEKTLAWPSVEPAARRTEFGCHATEVTVLRIGFFRCLDTHQLSSSSK